MIRTALAVARAFPLAAVILTPACGGESNQTGGTGGANGGAGTAGSGGAAGSAGKGGAAGSGNSGTGGANGGAAGQGGTSGSACPASVPSNGSACTAPAEAGFAAAHCSWGEDPRPECRTRALCFQNSWQVTEPDARCSEPPLPPACPASPAPMGTECSDPTLRCWYDDGTHCLCSPCSGGSEYPVCQTIDPPEWACATPPAGCPNPLPQAGEPCNQPDLSCGPSCEQPIRCQNGVWQWSQVECPICAAPDTPIATPSGERPIAELGVGDLVYSVEDAAIVIVPIVRVGSTAVARHRVVRLVLDSGSVLEMSPGHPTADGRLFSALAPGDALDLAHAVVSAEVVPYPYDRTYDILPASSSGAYFAGGALVGSTLRR